MAKEFEANKSCDFIPLPTGKGLYLVNEFTR